MLALCGREALAEDAQVTVTERTEFAGISLARNCRSETDVDGILAHAVCCGGTLRKLAQKVFWCGFSGYFSDPEWHLWQVAYHPFSPSMLPAASGCRKACS